MAEKSDIKLAYLILAHKNPCHLLRMINALNSPDVCFFVHIDKKSNSRGFESILTLPNVIFLKNTIHVNWGGFSIVQATLKLIDTALEYNVDFDYYILLSGADYPIKSPEYIWDFFKDKTKQFISLSPMPISRHNENKSMERLEFCYLESLFHAKAKHLTTCHNLLRYYVNIFLKIFFPRDYHKKLNGMVPYAGHQWWALSDDAIRYVVDFICTNPFYSRFFQYAQVPDEIFFHTIIANSEFVDQTAPSLTYSNWLGRNYHPENISIRHIEEVIEDGTAIHDDIYGSGEFLFVRKIADNSDDVLDKIDQELLSNEFEPSCWA